MEISKYKFELNLNVFSYVEQNYWILDVAIFKDNLFYALVIFF